MSLVSGDRPSEAPETVEEKWHDFFCDPTDDSVLRSRDGMLFRVSSWKFAKHSTVFMSMRETSGCVVNTAPLPVNHPVELDMDSGLLEKVAGHFCSYPSSLHRPSKTVTPHITLDQSLDLLHFGRLYDSPYVITIAAHRLSELSKEHMWSILGFASNTNDVELAKIALARFSTYRCTIEQFWLGMKGLHRSYQLAIVHLFDPDMVSTGGTVNSFKVTNNGKKFAESFDPSKFACDDGSGDPTSMAETTQ